MCFVERVGTNSWKDSFITCVLLNVLVQTAGKIPSLHVFCWTCWYKQLERFLHYMCFVERVGTNSWKDSFITCVLLNVLVQTAGKIPSLHVFCWTCWYKQLERFLHYMCFVERVGTNSWKDSFITCVLLNVLVQTAGKIPSLHVFCWTCWYKQLERFLHYMCFVERVGTNSWLDVVKLCKQFPNAYSVTIIGGYL